MSWTPYNHEDEERRDSERFADASVFDGPDPSEYMDYPEDEHEWQAESSGSVPTYKPGMMVERPAHKPGMIDENTALKVLLGMLFAVLAGLMLWILIGAAVMRWLS